MVPDSFTNFFIASASAGAALLGLLFVSISISPEDKIAEDAPIERRTSAQGALTLLINAFFLSLASLLPSNFGIPVTIFATLSFVLTLQNSINLLRPHPDASKLSSRLFIALANLLTYVAQGYYGILLIMNPNNPVPVFALTNLLLVVYVLGIVRAWQLLGGVRRQPKPQPLAHPLPPASEDVRMTTSAN
jgi:hypothetical protein